MHVNLFDKSAYHINNFPKPESPSSRDDTWRTNHIRWAMAYEAMKPHPRILDHAPIWPHFLQSADVIVLSADPRISVFEDGYSQVQGDNDCMTFA